MLIKFSEIVKMGMPLLEEGVLELGFKKAKGYKYSYVREMHGGVDFYISFDPGNPHPGHCFLSPIIAVEHKGFAALIEEITGIAMGEAIAGRYLGYYMPQNADVTWDLGVGDMHAVVADLFLALKTYGLPEMERMLDIDYFVEQFRKYAHYARNMLPVIYYKLGEYDKCIDYMKESLGLLTVIPSRFRFGIDYHQFYDKMVGLIETAKSAR